MSRRDWIVAVLIGAWIVSMWFAAPKERVVYVQYPACSITKPPCTVP